jgi:hypothetical protein
MRSGGEISYLCTFMVSQLIWLRTSSDSLLHTGKGSIEHAVSIIPSAPFSKRARLCAESADAVSHHSEATTQPFDAISVRSPACSQLCPSKAYGQRADVKQRHVAAVITDDYLL